MSSARSLLVAATRDAFDRRPLRPLLAGYLRQGIKLNPALAGTSLTRSKVNSGVFLHLPSQALERELDAIPSETSPAERRFLHYFFSAVWSGVGDVLEIGPFLGGSTRAIALGMLDNPCRDAQAQLVTFDRFADYYDGHALAEYITPLVRTELLGQDLVERVRTSGEFAEVFDRIHAEQRYSHLIRRCHGPLPDRPEHVDQPNLFAVGPDARYGAVFMDGLKSWFGTKYFFRAIAPTTAVGAQLLFQDYGAFTCFWLPAFTEVMNDCLRLTSAVDSTYVFQVIRQLSADVIDARFPDDPTDFERTRLDAMFCDLIERAGTRTDLRAQVVLRLQHAAALAYLGDTTEARRRIDAISRHALASPFEADIAAARASPTYRFGMEPIVLSN
jgi:hypothetical protein